MPVRLVQPAPAAYEYPLLVRHLLHTALATAPRQEIVYRDLRRHTYEMLHERIARLANVLAVPDERWGERPHVLVVRRPDWADRLTAASIRVHVAAAAQADTLPKYAIPEHVTFVAALEKTSVGKIDKRLLRDRYC